MYKPALIHHRSVSFLRAILIIAAAMPLSAATVTSSGNNGPGTLRHAINNAVNTETIDFDPSLSGQTIALSSSLVIDEELVIDASALSKGLIIEGRPGVRCFRITDGQAGVYRPVVFRGLTITKGDVAGRGANIQCAEALTLENCMVTEGNAKGATGEGGGIYCTGRLFLENTDINDNVSNVGGGGLHLLAPAEIEACEFKGNEGVDGGAIQMVNDALTIERCTFTSNHAANDGGAIFGEGELFLEQSLLEQNTADRQGGGIHWEETGADGEIRNCTIVESEPTGVFLAGGNLACNYSTIVDNGAGVEVLAGAQLAIAACIVRDNSGTDVVDPSGGITSGGWNWVHTGDIAAFSAAGDIVNGDSVQLSPLGLYGGRTRCRPPLPGSPATEVVPPLATSSGTIGVDQRGRTRSTNVTDIGAAEEVIRPSWDPPTPGVYGSGLSGSTLDFTASVPGTTVYNPPSGTVLDVGTHILLAEFTPDPVPYLSVTPYTASVPFTVTKRNLTIIPERLFHRVGEPMPPIILSYSTFQNGDDESVLDVLPSGSSSGGTGSPAGDYVISLSGGSDDQYDLVLQPGVHRICGIEVTNTLNEGPGSLRCAVEVANPGETITFSPDLNGQTIDLTWAIKIRKSLTIDASALPDGITIDGGYIDELLPHNIGYPGTGCFVINDGDGGMSVPVEIRNLCIRNAGYGNSFAGIGTSGGAIDSEEDLTLENCRVIDSISFPTLGRPGQGAGVGATDGSLVIRNCTFVGNYAGGSGGAINSTVPTIVEDTQFIGNEGQQGGAVYATGTLRMNRCLIMGNSAFNTAYQTGFGGGVYAADELVMEQCSIISNDAPSLAGGVYAQQDAFVTNCVFVGNEAKNGGAIYGDPLRITHCTVTGNISTNGTGAAMVGSIALRSCLVKENDPEDVQPADQASTVLSEGYNWIGSGFATPFTEPGDRFDTDPSQLGPLEEGPLLPGLSWGLLGRRPNPSSPAVNGGGAGVVLVDLHGDLRVGIPDIGAVEAPLGELVWAPPASISYGTPLDGTQLNAAFVSSPPPATPPTLVYTPAAGTVLDAGTHTLSVLVTFAPGRTETHTVPITVTPAPLTITANDEVRLVNTANPSFSASVSGLVNGDQISDLDTASSFSTTATTSSPEGAYAISVNGTADPNYTVTHEAGILTVTSRSVPNATWANPAPIVYGTPLSATQLNAVFDEPGTLTYTPPLGTVLDAGNFQSLEVTFTPNDPVAVEASSATVRIDILQAPLTITADDATRLSGNPNPPLTFQITGFVNGEDISDLDSAPTVSVSAHPGIAPGMYPIRVFGGVSANYDFTRVNGVLTVTEKPKPTITWDPAAIDYGTPLGNGQLNATASLPGTFSYVPTAGTVPDAGSETLTVFYTPDDPASVSPTSSTVQLLVRPVPLTITARDGVRNQGQANPSFTYQTTGLVNGDSVSQLDSKPTLTTSATFDSPAGDYPITVNGGADANYIITRVSGTLTIRGKTVPIINWAPPAPIVYGTPLSADQLNAATVNNLPGTLTYTPPLGTVLDAGNNQTLQVDFTPTNPTSVEPASRTIRLDVQPAPLTLTARDEVRNQGQANPTFTFDATGFVNGDSVSQLDSQPTLSTTATSSSPAGDYPITVNGGADANYTITRVSGTLTISDKLLATINWANPAPIVYGTPLGPNQLNATVNRPGTLTYTPPLGTILNAGNSQSLQVEFTPTNPATVESASRSVSLDVQRASLTFVADDTSRNTGEANPAFTFTAAGFVNGDTLADLDSQPSLSSVATRASPAGSYPIVVSGGADINYDILRTDGLLEVRGVTPLLISEFKLTNNEVRWAAVLGRRYRLEHCSDISVTTPVWNDLGTVTASSAEAGLAVALSEGVGFFRVAVVP